MHQSSFNGLHLPLDLHLPDYLLQRRGGISFGGAPQCSSSSSSSLSRPRLGRRAGISFDSKDKTAIYVRQLGDVKLQSQQDKLHQYMLDNLLPQDKQLLQSLRSPTYKTRCGDRFLTLSGMRRRRRSVSKPAADIVDGFYKSPTQCLLDKASDWSFDVFCLNECSGGRPLFHMVLRLFQEHNLMEHFNLDIVKLMKFASLVEEGYLQNPYHNAIHAADVTQAMHCYITQEKIARHLSPLETLVAIISAITHDLEHPGVNQKFLIATKNHLASLYKNCSVLENHHWRTAVGILHESGLLDHLPVDDRREITRQMQSLILATDMSRQQEFYDKLCRRVAEDDIDMAKEEDKHFILQIALKCADISNPCRSWKTCSRWGRRVCDEFFRQGDYERTLDLPVTALCDRYKDTIPEIQQKFLQYVMEPLFVEFSKFLPGDLMTEQVNNIRTNMEMWKSLPAEELPSLEVDINSNNENVVSRYSESDASSDSGNLPPLVNGILSRTPSEIDEALPDISDIHTNIVLVKERMDWPEGKLSDRRPSLPLTQRLAKGVYSRRESFPRIEDNRTTTCLPHTDLYQALSYDQLVEKLTGVNGDFTKKHSFNLDNFLSEPRLSTLSPSLETSRITNYMVTKQLMSK